MQREVGGVIAVGGPLSTRIERAKLSALLAVLAMRHQLGYTVYFEVVGSSSIGHHVILMCPFGEQDPVSASFKKVDHRCAEQLHVVGVQRALEAWVVAVEQHDELCLVALTASITGGELPHLDEHEAVG